jgi:predicted GIY-YIG superfamily endonuclease
MSRRLRSDPEYNQEVYLASCHTPSIYFVRAGTTGPVKIGYTNNINRRIKNLQQGNPNKLVLLGLMTGTRDTERALHEKFAKYRLEGEWFRPVPALLSLCDNDRKAP